MINITIGVDISKDHLDVHRLPEGEHRRYRNTSYRPSRPDQASDETAGRAPGL